MAAILYLPRLLAGITIPWWELRVLKPETANSRQMIITTTHPEALPISTNGTNAAINNNLSAMGSINFPKVVTWFVLLAICPSSQSVKEASPKIRAARNEAILEGVIRKTTSNGSRKMRKIVILLGKFNLYIIRKYYCAVWGYSFIN